MLPAVALAAPAHADGGKRIPQVQAELRLQGAVELRWHGAPGACEAARLCGVTGVSRWRPAPRGVVTYHRSAGRLQPSFVEMDDLISGTTRVVRTDSAGGSHTCLDRHNAVVSFSTGLALSGGPSAPRLGVGESIEDSGPLSAGRCPGPLAADFRDALPSAPYVAGLVDLRGRRAWAAGPYAGEVVSTLRVRVGRPAPSRTSFSISGEGAGPGAPVRVALVDLRYRVVRADGGMTVELAGLEDPACELYDSCGAAGRIDYAVGGAEGRRVELTGYRYLAEGETYDAADAERDLRAGRLGNLGGGLGPDAELTRSVTASVLLAGETEPCVDRTTGTAAPLLAFGPGARVRFALDESNYAGLGDQLRTRCPGPTGRDVLGGGPLLRGSVPTATLLDPGLTVTMAADRPFAAGGWTGRRTGSLTLELERTRFAVRIVRGGGF